MKEIGDPIIFGAYFIAMCINARFWARNRSYVSVKVSDHIRYILLIISFEQIRISVFCVISQLYLYAMVLLFVVSKIISLETIVSIGTGTLISWLTLFHIIVLVVMGSIESHICEWRYKRRR